MCKNCEEVRQRKFYSSPGQQEILSEEVHFSCRRSGAPESNASNMKTNNNNEEHTSKENIRITQRDDGGNIKSQFLKEKVRLYMINNGLQFGARKVAL
jgi:hypothetical protein